MNELIGMCVRLERTFRCENNDEDGDDDDNNNHANTSVESHGRVTNRRCRNVIVPIAKLLWLVGRTLLMSGGNSSNSSGGTDGGCNTTINNNANGNYNDINGGGNCDNGNGGITGNHDDDVETIEDFFNLSPVKFIGKYFDKLTMLPLSRQSVLIRVKFRLSMFIEFCDDSCNNDVENVCGGSSSSGGGNSNRHRSQAIGIGNNRIGDSSSGGGGGGGGGSGSGNSSGNGITLAAKCFLNDRFVRRQESVGILRSWIDCRIDSRNVPVGMLFDKRHQNDGIGRSASSSLSSATASRIRSNNDENDDTIAWSMCSSLCDSRFAVPTAAQLIKTYERNILAFQCDVLHYNNYNLTHDVKRRRTATSMSGGNRPRTNFLYGDKMTIRDFTDSGAANASHKLISFYDSSSSSSTTSSSSLPSSMLSNHNNNIGITTITNQRLDTTTRTTTRTTNGYDAMLHLRFVTQRVAINYGKLMYLDPTILPPPLSVTHHDGANSRRGGNIGARGVAGGRGGGNSGWYYGGSNRVEDIRNCISIGGGDSIGSGLSRRRK